MVYISNYLLKLGTIAKVVIAVEFVNLCTIIQIRLERQKVLDI